MVNLMHKGCSFEDISPPQPFLCQCLAEQFLLKLLVPPSLLCYCQLNTSSECCNIPCSHLTHTQSSPLLSSAFLSCQELQQLERPLEKKYLQRGNTHPILLADKSVILWKTFKITSKISCSGRRLCSLFPSPCACCTWDMQHCSATALLQLPERRLCWGGSQSLLLCLQWEY